MWCRTSTTSAATSASVMSSGSRLTSMCPGGNAKVCSFQLSSILYFHILSPPDFFIQLDQECGPLTLHSSLKDLVYYTRRGLRTLSASSSEEVPHPPFFHPPGPSEQDHKPVMKWNGGQLESQIWTTMNEALWTWRVRGEASLVSISGHWPWGILGSAMEGRKAPIQLVMGQQCRSGLVIIRCQFADN